ncbi:MAG: hypothetical protein ACP5IK_00860 [Candidatus Micrarchaeia archaeon]|jgi:hypothetical protein
MLSGKNLFIAIILVAILLVLVLYLVPLPWPARAILAIIILGIDLVGFATKYYDYFLIPLLRMKNRTVVLSEEPAFRIAPDDNTILKNVPGGVYASAFINIPIYKSATEMDDGMRLDIATTFSKILSLSKEPMKFSTILYVVNKDEYIQEIRNKLDEAEAKYAQLNAQSAPGVANPELERAKGEATMWRNLFDNISRVKSSALANIIMVTAFGGNEEEAIAIASQKAEEIAAGVSALLGVNAYIMSSKEFLKFIEPEELMPIGTISEELKEKIASVGV